MSSPICFGYLTLHSSPYLPPPRYYFSLQDSHLLYFAENPNLFKGKEKLNQLKGIVFLRNAEMKRIKQKKKLLVLKRKGMKDMVFKCQSSFEVRCWYYALRVVIQSVNDYYSDFTPTGWLWKKGGKGHKFTNWQKRWFKLQGTMLFYFTSVQGEGDVNVEELKGYIDVGLITEITQHATAKRDHTFALLVDNEKEFFLSGVNKNERNYWYGLISSSHDLMNAKYAGRLPMREKIYEVGLPLFNLNGKWKKACLCITAYNMRFYNPDRIFDSEETWDFFKDLHARLPLLGSSVKVRMEHSGDQIMRLTDMRGNKYYIKDAVHNYYEWKRIITEKTHNLIDDVFVSGSKLRLNAYARANNANEDEGYTIMNISQDTVEFHFILSHKKVEVPLENMTVKVDNSLLLISFILSGEKKSLQFRSENPEGLRNTFKYVIKREKKKSKRERSVRTARQKTLTESKPDSSSEDLDQEISVNDFTLVSVIGRGAFGKVLLCHLKNDPSNLFAMKCILKKSISGDPKEIENTLRERELMTQLRHPFVMSLHYAFQTKDQFMTVMDYVSGGELFFHLENEGVFEYERVVFYTAELLCALEYLHKKNIVYRDLKTENILLDKDGHVVLTDFGLSKKLGTNFRTETLCGTPVYAPPEMILEEPYGTAVDFWSLGILIYEMLFGELPFYHRNIQKMYALIVYEDPDFPEGWEDTYASNIILRLLRKDSEKRLTDFARIKRHPFFEGIDWEKANNRQLVPPFVPEVSDPLDTRNFNEELLMEDVKFDEAEELTKEELDFFSDVNFTYQRGEESSSSESDFIGSEFEYELSESD